MHRCPSCGVDLAIEVHKVEHELPPQDRRPDGTKMPAEMNDHRAAAFTMPFGKHKGLTLGEIHRKDSTYLGWGMDQGWNGALGRAVSHFLDSRR